MSRFLKALACVALLALQIAPASAWIHGGNSISLLANSQFNPNFANSGSYEQVFLNMLKAGPAWTFGDNSGHPTPAALNGNGEPLPGGACFSHSGCYMGDMRLSNQFERPGNWAAIAAGRGKLAYQNTNGTIATGACSGTTSGTPGVGGTISCDNSACSSATGSISGQTLTITVASSCQLLLYQPITSGSTTTNQFGVPTAIIGMSGSANCPTCNGTGGTGTYLVNFSQTVASGSLIPGIINKPTISNEIATGLVAVNYSVQATDATNPLNSFALVHENDLLLYYQGQISGATFKQRVSLANFLIERDLNLNNTNPSSIATWGDRKPTAYVSWTAPEMRNSLYAGSPSYVLNGSSNNYAVNLGVSLPADKQHVCVQWLNSSTTSTIKFRIDNGVTYYPVLEFRGGFVPQSGAGQWPVANNSDGLTFDATLQAWLTTGAGQSSSCLNNYMPPEAFIQMNSELGTVPWVVMPMYASDPITDYPIQYALLLQGYSWRIPPQFEIPDEPWNCGGGGIGPYPSAKSRAYIAADPTHWSNGGIFCQSGGDIPNWSGKAGSLLAQAIRQVSSTYTVIVGVQTTWTPTSTFNNSIRSASYVAQNPANIPIQSGCAGVGAIQTLCPTPFRQTAAYTEMKGSTATAGAITIANYWSIGGINGPALTGQELQLAFCYYYQAAGCASQSSIMTTYFGTQPITQPSGDFAASTATWLAWYNFAKTCAGGASCTPLVVFNYEGTFTTGSVSADQSQTVTAASAATNAILSVAGNGCAANEPVALSGLSGGTWAAAGNGPYTVQATGTDSTHCAINLNSTGLGTLGATATASGSTGIGAGSVVLTAPCPTFTAGSFQVNDLTNSLTIGIATCSGSTLTFPNLTGHSVVNGDTLQFFPLIVYTGSKNYINYLRNSAWIAPYLATWTTTLYNAIASTSGPCAPDVCSYYPSQFNLAAPTGGGSANCCWLGWSTDIFGNFAIASASQATASGGNLTLGGTITGIFKQGQTIIGGGISGVTITGACSQTGSLPAGANVGDVCPLSASPTMTSNAVNGSIVPSSANDNPIKSNKAICAWNGNSNCT